MWSLSNAFTSAFKSLAPMKQFEVTARLGSHLKKLQSGAIQNVRLPDYASSRPDDHKSVGLSENSDEKTPKEDINRTRAEMAA